MNEIFASEEIFQPMENNGNHIRIVDWKDDRFAIELSEPINPGLNDVEDEFLLEKKNKEEVWIKIDLELPVYLLQGDKKEREVRNKVLKLLEE